MICEILQSLINIDTNSTLYSNEMHNSFADTFMYVFSSKLIWVPMYASIIYLLLKNFNWRITIYCIIAAILTIAFADQMCAHVIRPMVCRLRPANLNNPLHKFIHIVYGYRGGKYSFPSCHSANSFAFAFYVFLVFKKRWLTIFVMTWATINSYSRIYLGVHYVGDIIAGAIIGTIGAYLIYYLLQRFTNYKPQKIKQSWVTMAIGGITTAAILIYCIIKIY